MAQAISKEAIIEELWHRGKSGAAILSDAQKKIRAVYEAKHDKTVSIECSRQLGKTFFGCYLADETARNNPNAQIRLGTAFEVDIESIVVPNFKNVLASCPESIRPKYVSQKKTYRYANGSVITLVGLDKNPDKMRGSRIRLSIIEEAGFVDSETLKYVLESVVFPAQLREPQARTVLISTPPSEGTDHYFCELSDKLALVGSYIKLTIDESGLPQSQIDDLAKALGGRNSIAFRRECLCERIIDTEKAIVPEFKESLHVMRYTEPGYRRYLQEYAGLDSGVRDKTVALWGYYDFPAAKLVIQAEAHMQGSEVTTQNILKAATDVESKLGYKENTRRIADNDNLILIQDLSTLGKHWHPTDKDSLEAMVNELRLWFGANRIVIDPACKLLIGTLRSALWNKHRTEFSRTKLYGHADALSALMYLVRNVNSSHNPIPADYGVDLGNQILPFQSHLSQSARGLKQAFNLKG